MSAALRGFIAGLACTLTLSASVGWWLGREPTAAVIVAATDIPEGTPITISMLDLARVPERFVSSRKLGAVNVAVVTGQAAPQSLRARDFLDPTHFGPSEDPCVLDARATGARLGLDAPQLDLFLATLKSPD